jgi:hypothetical protein
MRPAILRDPTRTAFLLLLLLMLLLLLLLPALE